MQFNSLIFLLSLTVFIFLYFILKNNFRKILLLIGNLLFYLSFGYYGLIVLISILLIIYVFGIALEKYEHRKITLITGILFVLSFIVFFKYFNFIFSIYPGSEKNTSLIKLSAPIGLSFYTFSSISYLIEVYRNRIRPERNILSIAQFITFFPLIVSGPIERPYNMIPQFKENQNFDYDRIKSGLIFITLGFFKKVVISDRLDTYVGKVFAAPEEFRGVALIIGTVLFSVQIYCDFSGYTDIAIGIAKILGFKVSENFNLPYYAKSIQDFWSRWHITLSKWLRDYIFLPVAYSVTRKLNNKPFAGIKPESWSYITGIIFTMFICGLWHGANWTFIVWGLIHAFLLVFAFMTKKIRKKIVRKTGIENTFIYNPFKVAFIFSVVTVAWVFFRAADLSEAIYIIKNFTSGINSGNIIKIFSSRFNFVITIILIIILELIHRIQKSEGILVFLNRKPVWQRWGIYYLFIFMILILGRFDVASFIYAKF
jgi:alginate O-acetyltransferase complex protein AlgI